MNESYELSYMPDCADKLLELTTDIAAGYDNCQSVKSLQELIDEMVEYVNAARICMKQGKLYEEVV